MAFQNLLNLKSFSVCPSVVHWARIEGQEKVVKNKVHELIPAVAFPSQTSLLEIGIMTYDKTWRVLQQPFRRLG